MAKRPAHTLILLGAERTDRVDVGPGPNFPVLAEHHHATQGADDPVHKLEASLVATPKLGKQVWLLWEGASAHVLEMPAGVVEGLEREQLTDTLSFEAESLTGIPAGDSAIDGVPQAVKSLAEFKRFWITQVSVSTRRRFEEAVVRANAKLAGIVHPGGLPRSEWNVEGTTDVIAEWRRVEVWDQLTFSLHGTTDGRVETKVIRTSPGSKAWSSQLPTEGPLSWMGPGPVTRVSPGGKQVADAWLPLTADGLPLQPTKIDFPQDTVPTDWLRAWAVELTSKSRRVPVVESLSRVSPFQKYYLVGGVAAALAFAACVGYGGLLKMRASQLHGRADQLERIRLSMVPPDNSDKEAASINADVAKLAPQLQDLEQQETELATANAKIQKTATDMTTRQAKLNRLLGIHRPALGELLAAIADSEKDENPGDIIIKEVRQNDNGGLRLTGLCSRPSLADGFATNLETRLTQAGWKVGAAQKLLRGDRQAFNFSVALTPAVLLDSAIPGMPLSPNIAKSPAATQSGIARRSVEAVGDHVP